MSASPIATAPLAHEFAVDRIGPRTSSAMPRFAGAAPPNTASASVGETDLQAALEVPLVLRLGERDPAQRRPEVDADPLARRRARAPGTSAASAIAIRPAASPNWLNRSIARAAGRP